MSLRVGIDTGGTFTDFVVLDGGRLRTLKVRSTPADPASAILEGLRDLFRPVGNPEPRDIVHGSTVATNALLERKGARVALVATEGFEDILRIGRQTREHLYQLVPEAPTALVAPADTIGVRERMLADGSAETPLDDEEIDRVVREVERLGVGSVAICLLHAYASPAHERALADRLAGGGRLVSPSHAILREYREYERCSTTVVNAYVTPLMGSYLRRLEKELPGDTLRVMQSNGGAMSAVSAARTAVHTVLSGPAGGVVGAASVAAAAGLARVISFDMGGTSTDVSLIDGVPSRTSESVVGGAPIRVPMLDIHTVGAGGGSIATLDAGGALRVGPQSAGADPGPACYGIGDLPTVTDANVVLGRIDPERFLGGRMRIFADRARRAIRALADRATLDPTALAEGIVRVANANMERAIRVVSVERGFDPRDFALLPFGGAGGLHAAEIADQLDIRTILVPADPGVLSAIGMLLSNALRDASRTLLAPVASLDPDVLEREFETLEHEARSHLGADGFGEGAILTERSIDVRYVGQAYEITVPAQGADEGGFVSAFHRAHERLYGYADPGRPTEVVNVRVRGIGVTAKPRLHPMPTVTPGQPATPVSCSSLFVTGAWAPVPIFDRGTIAPGEFFAGPALAVDAGSTTFVPAGWHSRADDRLNLVLTKVPRP